ncbi:MAG: hypothetical protein QOF21_993 [Actinomycetota bacterium]
MTSDIGVSTFERLEALIANDELYALADVIPTTEPSAGGRPRHYPTFMWILFDALLSVYGSARQVDAELAHPVVWKHLRDLVHRRFPDDPSKWIGDRPMRRHHYLYGRTRWLTGHGMVEQLRSLHTTQAVAQANDLGLLRENGPGSWTHPHLSRMVHADGKVLTPLFRAQPGDTRVDRTTGEILPVRAEHDAGLHFEGTGETAWGTKWVIAAVRSEERHGRIILDVDHVPAPGGEASCAVDSFRAITSQAPGVQGVIYDTALRGVHHQTLMRELGLLPVNKVTAAKAAVKQPRRVGGRRVPKSTHVEDRDVTLADGSVIKVSLFAHDGAIGVVTLDDTGNRQFTELARVRTHRNKDKGGYRWYNDYRLPKHLGGGTITVRLHTNDDDVRRKFNRTENVRPIAQGDPDFKRLYRRRNDAESINRALDDTLWLRRAHSVGHRRQHLNLITHALMVNSVAIARSAPTSDVA